jgi:hypothetical protein
MVSDIMLPGLLVILFVLVFLCQFTALLLCNVRMQAIEKREMSGQQKEPVGVFNSVRLLCYFLLPLLRWASLKPRHARHCPAHYLCCLAIPVATSGQALLIAAAEAVAGPCDARLEAPAAEGVSALWSSGVNKLICSCGSHQ